MAGGGGPVDAASGMVFAGRCARRVGCAFALVLAHANTLPGYPTNVKPRQRMERVIGVGGRTD